jgi:hypothetical protein
MATSPVAGEAAIRWPSTLASGPRSQACSGNHHGISDPGGSPAIGNGLSGITGGPDGNVYFTDTLNNAIGQVTPAGVITELSLPSSGGARLRATVPSVTAATKYPPLQPTSTTLRRSPSTLVANYSLPTEPTT